MRLGELLYKSIETVAGKYFASLTSLPLAVKLQLEELSAILRCFCCRQDRLSMSDFQLSNALLNAIDRHGVYDCSDSPCSFP